MGAARLLKIGCPVVILFLVLSLAGCGGGGGGGSSPAAEDLTTLTVTGKILGIDGNPVSGATVTITSDTVTATTNEWGEFSAKVAPGEHTITVTKDNVTLYRSTFSAEAGSQVVLGTISPNFPDGSGDTQAPTVPGGVAATAASSSQINLSWNASTDNALVTSYRIYRNGTQLSTLVTGTTYSDTGLSASTQYCYTVSAGDAKGNWSALSSQSCATTLGSGASGDTQAPSVPVGATASAVSSSQVNISWIASTDNVGVSAYRIYRNGSPLPTTVTATTYSDTGLSASTPYCYTISACDAAGNWSAQCAQVCVTTWAFQGDSQAPTVPGSVIATAQTSRQINLSWSASTDNVGVAAYRIYRNGTPLPATVPATTYSDTGLTPGTQYCYRVSAGDAAGNWSGLSTQGPDSCATTPASTDTTPPTVSSVSPLLNATNVAANAVVSATFSEAVDPNSVTGATFVVSAGAVSIPGTISFNGTSVFFTPSPALDYGTRYNVRLTTGITDLAGNPLAAENTWSFTTAYGSIPELFMQLMSEPTQAHYDVLMGAIDAADDSKLNKIYKAMGELLDIYNSPKTRQIIAAAGLPTIGFDTDFEQLEALYNINAIVDTYFKQSPSLYEADSQALFLETENRLADVDALLAQADGINETVSYGPLYTVNIDSIDVKILRSMVNLAKAYFVYLQSLNLAITNYSVVYDNVTYDIRDLYTNKPDVLDYDALLESAWLQVLNNNPTLLTYKDRSGSSKLAQFRSTLQTAFDFYGSAVTDIAALTDEQKRNRYNSAFSLDGDASMAMAQLVRDQGMVSAMACMNGTSSELVFPRAAMTNSEYVDAADDDDLYYLKETFDIYLDTFCHNSAASAITAFSLFGSGAGADKTPRDLILEVTALPDDADYEPYILCGAPVLYLSGVSDIIWQDFMETFPVPAATITIDGLSGDWDSVPVFYTFGGTTYKLARDASNNVYLSIESIYDPSVSGYWYSQIYLDMEYGGDDLGNYAYLTIGCYIYGSSTLNVGCNAWEWPGTSITCQGMKFGDAVGVEMSAPVLSKLLKVGSGNYFWVSDNYNGYFDEDRKLLPEMP